MKKEHGTYHWVCVLLLGAAALLTACSDEAETTAEETNLLQLVATTWGMPEEHSLATRTISLPDHYVEYKGPGAIGVYMTMADEAPKMRTFYYEDNQWNSLVSVKNTTQYYIYGYMPASVEINSAISKRQGVDYSQGAVLTFTDLPPVLAEDFSVITGVLPLNVESAEQVASIDVAKEAWVKGQFGFLTKQPDQNFVCLMLDHLYACARLKFQVDADYGKLRTIKLKEVKLKSAQQVSYPLTVTMIAGEDYVPVWGEARTLSNDFVSLFTSKEGVKLPTSSEEATEVCVDGYFVPKENVAENLVLECTYDVYDNNTEENSDGNLVRKNCVAINKLPALGAEANQRTLLTLMVKPTYLYVLSEPDVDNPTITVGN